MLLKNQMEDKQLNFNQPLLSVRRHAPTMTSQRSEKTRSNYSSRPVRRDYYSRPVVPQLPPHRPELKSGPITNAGTVPFMWEHTPGQPKEEIKPQTQDSDRPPIAPKLPPGRSPKAIEQDCHIFSPNTIANKSQVVSENKRQDVDMPSDSHIDKSHDETVKNCESIKETTEEKERSDSGDSDGAYVDALDTLSRTESYFLNCSMSGVSGLDNLDAKPSTDIQAREFMMDRFLPAAKAMATETPHAPKKQPFVQQHTRQLTKIVDQNKPLLRYGPSFAKKYSHYVENEEQEESDDEYDQRENLPPICGLLPRFCLKSSLCLLNPVPAMSVRTRVPISTANKVRRRSSSGGSFSETENESRSDRTEVKSIDKIQTDELHEDKTEVRNESGQLESHCTSAYHDSPRDVLLIPEEKIHSEIDHFGLNRKGFKTFHELLADQDSPEELNSGGSVTEKTLYVDTVQTVELGSPNMRPFSPNSSRDEDHEIITKRIDQMHAVDSSDEDLKKLNSIDADHKLQPNAEKFADCCILSSIDESTMEMPQVCNLDSTNKKNIEVTEQEAKETLEKQLSNYSGLPAPPPLPKSPSDSWLWRTLPSMSTKNSSLRSYLGATTNPENHCSKAPKSDTKWETIVRTTKVQTRHMHHPEEMLSTIPEA